MKRLKKEKELFREEDQFVTYNEMVNFVTIAIGFVLIVIAISGYLFKLF